MSTQSARPSPFAQIGAAPRASDKGKAVDPAEDDEDLEDDPNDDDETKKAKKAKRAKKARQAEEDDKKDDEDSKCRAARQRERARCAAIFAAPEAALNVVATCHLAFTTSMPPSEAIRTLAALNSDRVGGGSDTNSTGLADRILAAHAAATGEAASRRSPRRAAAPASEPVGATAAAIIAADKKARGEA